MSEITVATVYLEIHPRQAALEQLDRHVEPGLEVVGARQLDAQIRTAWRVTERDRDA